MIKTFKHKGLEAFFCRDSTRLLPFQHVSRISRVLDRLDAIEQINDMDLPGYKLHRLVGNRKNTWSVAISGNWRITFEFQNGDVYNVNLEDYH